MTNILTVAITGTPTLAQAKIYVTPPSAVRAIYTTTVDCAAGDHVAFIDIPNPVIIVADTCFRCVSSSDGSTVVTYKPQNPISRSVTVSTNTTITFVYKEMDKCPACGEGIGADSDINVDKKVVTDGRVPICLSCGYDDTQDPKFTET